MNFQRISFAAALTLMLPMISFAESGDSDKPVQIFSDKFDGDDVKQVAIYTGNVAVHQGTLEIHGAKLVLSIDPQGFRHAVMTPEKGKLVRFKQRRDQQTPGVEEWMHGEGDKLTYNEKSNQLILTTVRWHRALCLHIAREDSGHANGCSVDFCFSTKDRYI